MGEILDNFEDLLVDNNEETQVQEEETLTPSTPYYSENSEEYEENEEDNEEEEGEEENEEIDYSGNPLYSFLQSRGISDPSRLQYENEDGEIVEVDFATLDPSEQQEIINQVTDPGLTEDEVNTINYLRQNRATLGQVVEYYAQQKLNEYLSQNPDKIHQQIYSIDDYSDDELYFADLKSRFKNLTDDDLYSKLESAKDNEEVFKKEVSELRELYKAQEDQERAAAEQREAQQAQDLRNELVGAAGRFKEIALDFTDSQSDTLVIEDEDRNDMIAYVLAQDADGQSQLMKDLNNPDALMELAWLRTRGAQVLSDVTKYWKDVLAKERANSKKLQSQIDKLTRVNNNSVVLPRDPSKESTNRGPASYWDKYLK